MSAIQLLRCHGDLVDCTLAAGGRSFPAHKIVLCAASPFLFDLLKNTPCKHPVVMLAGVNANDLEALLEFVYRGEVSVDHSQLPSLLQAAHCLNIQGLAPQTVTKDDYTTQIQLHPMMQPHYTDHDQEQLIATIAAPQQHTVHAQVVEDINAGTITAHVQDVKDVINQFLPARKRKPRAKKSPVSKIPRTDGMDTTTITTQTTTENGETTIASTPIKPDPSLNDTVATIATDSSATTPATPSTTKTGSAAKPRSRSQSEQPATCPICFAIIRQSRNLRRHLELRHFAKPGVKKERKGELPSAKKPTTGTAATTPNTITTTVPASNVPTVQTVQTLHTLQTVQVKKEPDAMGSVSAAATTPVTVTVQAPQTQQIQVQSQQHISQQQQQQQTQQQAQQQQTQQQQQQQQQQTAIIDQTGTITTSGGQQQLVTQTENTDGTTSLSIAHVQTLQGHQLTLQNLNQAAIIRNDELASGIIATHEPTLRPHTELYRVGAVYTIEEREFDNNKLS